MNKRIKNKIDKRQNIAKHQEILATLKQQGFTPIKEHYLDGYYIFDFGKASVCHFEIEEIPGYLFAIWLYKNKMTDIFCEPIEFIDKFKPSYVTYAYQNLDEFIRFLVDMKSHYDYYYAKCWNSSLEKEDKKGIQEVMNELEERRIKKEKEDFDDWKYTFEFFRKGVFEELPMVNSIGVTDENIGGFVCFPRYNVILELNKNYYQELLSNKEKKKEFWNKCYEITSKFEDNRPIEYTFASDYKFSIWAFVDYDLSLDKKRFTYIYKKED